MIFKKLKQKRERKIQEKSYAARFDRVLINNKVTHQNIGCKIGYVMKEISSKELENEIRNLNIACCNFMKRREDLCNNFLNEEDSCKKMQDKRRHILKPIVKEQNIGLFAQEVESIIQNGFSKQAPWETIDRVILPYTRNPSKGEFKSANNTLKRKNKEEKTPKGR